MVPHIVEANILRRGVWFRRAQLAGRLIAQAFGVSAQLLCNRIDMLMKGLSLVGRQRQNYTGRGFMAVLKILLQKVSGVTAEKEVLYKDIPKLTSVTRRKCDLVVPPPPNSRVIISVKWSLRHDRLRDIMNEADECKREWPEVKFLIVTNEFQPGRLSKVAGHPNIDAAYHVHLPLLQQLKLRAPKGLKDLASLFSDVKDCS